MSSALTGWRIISLKGLDGFLERDRDRELSLDPNKENEKITPDTASPISAAGKSVQSCCLQLP